VVYDAHGCGAATCPRRWKSANDPSEIFQSPAVVTGGALYFLVRTGFGNSLRKLSLPG
jgi:hypothetical protein